MLNKKDIVRNVVLASCLEVIPDKKGCTSKNHDYKESSKFEYFLISAINIGNDIHNLIKRIEKNNNKQPNVIYDIALHAQNNSIRNRNGGKINFGIIELFIPIITSQLVYSNNNVDVLLDNVTNILKNTSQYDVKYHWEFRKKARNISGKVPDTTFYNVDNIYDYYSLKLNCLDDYVHEQYLSNLPIIKRGYELLLEYYNGNILDASVLVFNDILEDCHNFSVMAADYICVILYLFLCYNSDKIII